MIEKAVIALLGVMAFAVLADQYQPLLVVDAASPPDAVAEFQNLKYQVLQAQAGVELTRPKANGSVTFYVGNMASPLKLTGVTASLDGQQIASEEVDDTAFHSLGASDRLIRLGDAVLAEGAHAIHAEFRVVDASTPDLAEQIVTLDDSVEVGRSVKAISLRLEPSRVVMPLRIVMQRNRTEPPGEGWALRTLHEMGRLGGVDGRYIPGEAGDPAVAYAEYLRNSGQAERAAVELLKLPAGGGDTLPPAYWLRIAAVLREVGLWDYSRAICERLDAQHQQPQAVATERLNVALQDYDVGRVAQAEAALQAIGSRVPEDRVQDWQLGYAQILFLHDRYREAEAVLQDRDTEGTEAYRYATQSQGAILTTAFRRYNLAVAMVHNGEEKKGLSLLDLIGRMKALDKDLVAVRDQANLALGWHFLRKKQGITAMGVLGRVSMEGRWSEPALLGMGWAQLAPAGGKIPRVRLDREASGGQAMLPAPLKHSLTELGVFDPELDESGGPAAFARGDPPSDRTEGLKRALLFWQVLAARDPGNAAVQEGLLAIAYAYECLDANAAARKAYESAIGIFEAGKKGLRGEAGVIRATGLAALVDQARDSQNKAALLGAGYLKPTEHNRTVFGAAERYRELFALEHEAHELAQHAPAETAPDFAGAASRGQMLDLEQRLSALRARALKDAESLAAQDLDRQAGITDQYLQAAYFAAARASDRTVAYEPR